MGYIRIESHQKVVTNAKVFYVNGDEEIDISNCVQVVDLHLAVGEVSKATLVAILGSASVTAQVEDVVINRLKPKGDCEVTAFSDMARRMEVSS